MGITRVVFLSLSLPLAHTHTHTSVHDFLDKHHLVELNERERRELSEEEKKIKSTKRARRW
jgi:hypothetical protein